MESHTHHSIEIPERNLKLWLPRELAHCDSDGFAIACGLIYDWSTKKIDFDTLAIQLTYKLLGLTKGKSELNSLEVDYKNANIAMIAEKCIPTFFTKVDEGLSVKLNFTHNHTPSVTPIRKTYFGPTTRFHNVTFGQYEDGLNLFHLFHKHPSDDVLRMLMATFYMAKDEKYSNENVERKAKKLKLIDFGKVYGFYQLFSAFQIYLTSTIVLWEGNKIDFSILFKDQGDGDDSFKSDIPGLGFKSIAYQLAESGVFGSLKEMRSENLWEILLRLYDIRKRDLDFKAEQKLKEKKP